MRFTASVQREGDGYVAQALEIDVASQGPTIEAAVANLREAIELLLEEEPTPSAIEPALVTTIDVALPAAS
ncbi:MAG: type II toxin-antitoxin system HicB family antitoxin [Myxococcales bacterium]|nr:type II toxin-antitoxin system HicB family antitoxin [Myxococcales bacterium]